jgi:pescadillo protein
LLLPVAATDAASDAHAAATDAACSCSHTQGLTFFLAREVPREPLLLVIRAFGGAVSWEGDGAPLAENSPSITHQVVDRPTQGHRFLSRAYVQPQWVLDCANFRVLLPNALYAPGTRPPPHLSPFVDNDEEGYTPDFALTVKKLQVRQWFRCKATRLYDFNTDSLCPDKTGLILG